MDGRLDESVYDQMQPASDFVQQVPREGALATERDRNDERDTLARGYPDLKNRAFVVKINRLLRF